MAVIVSEADARELVREAAAVGFLSDAFNHLKAISCVPAAKMLLHGAGITEELVDDGVVTFAGVDAIAGFIAAARNGCTGTASPKYATCSNFSALGADTAPSALARLDALKGTRHRSR
jgi:hypothetical protein